MPISDAGEFSEDRLLGGRLVLRQPRRGNRASIDALLLAAAVPARPGETVADLGAGSGVAGLAVTARVPDVRLLLVDADPAMVALAEGNLALNDVRGRAVAADVSMAGADRASSGLVDGCADHVIANPPYFEAGSVRPPPDAGRRRAFIADAPADDWLRTAAALVRPGGTITVIGPVAMLGRLFGAMEGRAGGMSVLPVHPRPGAAAIRVIVQGTKGSRAPLRLLSGLDLHPVSGNDYAPAVDAVLSAAAALHLLPKSPDKGEEI